MTERGNAAYLREIDTVLPRLLALYDRDPASPTFGLGDRLHWGWKLIDFPNATAQGAVHGLAILLSSGRLPDYLSRNAILERIDSMILAAGSITGPDGSLAEAFPRESSFCVTALIAYDILAAAGVLTPHVGFEVTARWNGIVEPLIAFLIRNEETHAIISNHLATGVAALLRWEGQNREAARNRGEDILKRIIVHQSDEGWFSEYGAFDPGYETLGLTYLADVHKRHPELRLGPKIENSLVALSLCAHPDGSFGGIYGCRNTRFIMPGGLEELSSEFPLARSLAAFARNSIEKRKVVTLSVLDEGNLAPVFNSYCRAAAVSVHEDGDPPLRLPFEDAVPWRKHLKQAGVLFDNGPSHYTVVSLKKGGVVQHYTKDQSTPVRIDAGVLAKRSGKFYSTQAWQNDNRIEIDSGRVVVEAPFVETKGERPGPFQFVILRLLCLTLFRYRPFLEFVKRRLVNRLITGQKRAGVSNRRTIHLGANLKIEDEMLGNGLEPVVTRRPFTAIHMASAGYWQSQDDAT